MLIRPLIVIAVLFGGVDSVIRAQVAPPANSIDADAAVLLSSEYLSAADDDRRALATSIRRFTGDWESIVRCLSDRSYRRIEPGYYQEERFESTGLRDKYSSDLLYFIVPDGYEPDRPTGLIVFLHGGGLTTSRDAPHYTLRFPTSESPPDTDRSGDMFAGTGMITVGPSAPGKGESYYRWCLKASEEYLADVIAECKRRFHIDDDRVFIVGHSMGGFGAFHHGLRQPDRFAAIICSSGAWDCGYWPVLRGTPFFLANGVHDAVEGERWHHTDVEYGRRTHEIFSREGLEHVYFEHDDGHAFSNNRRRIGEYFAEMQNRRRDAYYPRVAVATPQGFASNYLHPVVHNRWLTLNKATDGRITVDELDARGDEFDDWRLVPLRTRRRGAMIEAFNRGGNQIEVTTKNVAKFTIWLHPLMIDVARPVSIIVDGRELFRDRVQPSLVTALKSYDRRRDWGLIYPVKIEISLE